MNMRLQISVINNQCLVAKMKSELPHFLLNTELKEKKIKLPVGFSIEILIFAPQYGGCSSVG